MYFMIKFFKYIFIIKDFIKLSNMSNNEFNHLNLYKVKSTEENYYFMIMYVI